MSKIFLTLALAILAATAPNAAAQDKSAVVAVVHQFADSFNKGDAKGALAACADEVSIIDEFPPHEWNGADACAKWMNDYEADAKKNGVTGGMVTLGAARHVDVTADRAYVVAPADYAYKQNGKPVKEARSTLTVVLQKGSGGWRIIAWTWTKN